MEKLALAQEKVWFDKPAYDRAERQYFEKLAKKEERAPQAQPDEPCCDVLSCKITDVPPSREWYATYIPPTKRALITTTTTTHSKKKSKSKENKENREKLQPIDSGWEEVKSSKSQRKSRKAHKNGDELDQQQQQQQQQQKQQQQQQPQPQPQQKRDSHSSENWSSGPEDNKNCRALKERKKERKNNKVAQNHRNYANVPGIVEKENDELLVDWLPSVKNTEQMSDQGNQQPATPILPAGGSLANEVAKARQHIIQSLQCVEDIANIAGVCQGGDASKSFMELHNGVKEAIQKLEERVQLLEEKVFAACPQVCPMTACPVLAVCPAKPAAPVKQEPKEKDDGDDDVDLFGSESEGEDEEAAKVREERLAAYAAKKAKKPVLIAKSSIILDVKPWDDETDMAAMEAEVRKIEMNGLLWGASKLVPLAFTIKKLQISCVVEDDKVSVDELTEKIQDLEDYVQSVDIAAFNKI